MDERKGKEKNQFVLQLMTYYYVNKAFDFLIQH